MIPDLPVFEAFVHGDGGLAGVGFEAGEVGVEGDVEAVGVHGVGWWFGFVAVEEEA